jgi:hypothetical protein
MGDECANHNGEHRSVGAAHRIASVRGGRWTLMRRMSLMPTPSAATTAHRSDRTVGVLRSTASSGGVALQPGCPVAAALTAIGCGVARVGYGDLVLR